MTGDQRLKTIAAVLAVGLGVLMALKPVLILIIAAAVVVGWLIRHPLILLAALLGFTIGGS